MNECEEEGSDPVNKLSLGERIFECFNILFMICLCLVTLYPFVYVLFASLSDPSWLVQQRGLIWFPHGWSWDAYRLVFENPMIASGYLTPCSSLQSAPS